MKNLLSPFKNIIFLSFILFTIFTGGDGCKCGDLNSLSSHSSQESINVEGLTSTMTSITSTSQQLAATSVNPGDINGNSTPMSFRPPSGPSYVSSSLEIQIPFGKDSQKLRGWIDEVWEVYCDRNKRGHRGYPVLPKGGSTDKKRLIKIIFEEMNRERFLFSKDQEYLSDFYEVLLNEVNKQLYKDKDTLIKNVKDLIKETATEISDIKELVKMMGLKTRAIFFQAVDESSITDNEQNIEIVESREE